MVDNTPGASSGIAMQRMAYKASAVSLGLCVPVASAPVHARESRLPRLRAHLPGVGLTQRGSDAPESVSRAAWYWVRKPALDRPCSSGMGLLERAECWRLQLCNTEGEKWEWDPTKGG